MGLKVAMSATLEKLTMTSLQDAHVAIVNKSMPVPNSPSIHKEKEAIVARFIKNFGENFDALVEVQEKKVNVLDYASLSLVGEDDLEAIIAMEGMISHARNCDIPQYIKFSTRLDSMLFGTRIDESNNPMDPEQIGEAFKEAMRPVGLPAKNLLIAYRQFNNNVFHKLESILEEANDYLIGEGILADLDIAARDKSALLNKRNKQRQKEDPVDRAFRTADSQVSAEQQLFPLVQKLLHKLDGGNTAPSNAIQVESGLGVALKQGMMVGSKRVEVVSNEKLIHYLNELESQLDVTAGDAIGGAAGSAFDIRAPLGAVLEEKSDAKTLCAVNAESSDIINLVTLLYEAIWQEENVPIPIKELIWRTQITILKIALVDPTFFNLESHPVRVLLNELATAGITWTQPDKLEKDSMYQKIKEVIARLMRNFNGDTDFVLPLIEEFREFKKSGLLLVAEIDPHLSSPDERSQRMDEIREYALRKIDERILDKNLHPDVKNFLDNYFHKFLVQVILREGPGGISWRPVMNTIDVLLWTVQRERQERDLKRFIKVNSRLRTNLAKALDVAGIDKGEADAALQALQVVQNQSFNSVTENAVGDAPQDATRSAGDASAVEKSLVAVTMPDLPEDDEHLQEVSKYPIGLWFEFHVDGEQTIRCTLAAKIETIEKYVFVNGQGVKVIEKSRMGLARELKAGTVKVICDGPLIDRAMESVIAKLRGAGSTPAAER